MNGPEEKWYRAWRHEERRAGGRWNPWRDWLLLVAAILVLVLLVVGTLF